MLSRLPTHRPNSLSRTLLPSLTRLTHAAHRVCSADTLNGCPSAARASGHLRGHLDDSRSSTAFPHNNSRHLSSLPTQHNSTMGLLDAIYARAGSLNPVSPPVGRYPHMMRTAETTMAMKESLLSISGVSHRSSLVSVELTAGRLQHRRCQDPGAAHEVQRQDLLLPRPQECAPCLPR
jgi:hypothetical protein